MSCFEPVQVVTPPETVQTEVLGRALKSLITSHASPLAAAHAVVLVTVGAWSLMAVSKSLARPS